MAGYLPLIVFVAFFILMFIIRMPIPTGMIVACAMYFLVDGLCKGYGFGDMVVGNAGQLHLIAQKTIEAIFTNGTIVAVPLFVFAANLMNSSTVTDYIFGFCDGLVGRFRGGMAHVNVLCSLVFSGMTGSAIADATGIGTMEIEVMKKQGYDDPFSCAITAASATIGPIFPPSIPMVVYAMLTGASVGALFMGGMVPGILLALFLCVYIVFIARKRNYPRSEPIALKAYLKFLLKAIWALLTPVILLGCIYSGEYLYCKEENPDLAYVVPDEGSNVWVDSWVIPANAENKANAEKWIDFMCRPDIALKNFEYIWYATPNTEALKEIEPEIAEDSGVFPDQELIDRCEVFNSLDADVEKLYTDAYNQILAAD